MPVSNSKNMVQVLHICRVGRTLLLVAQQHRRGGLGITSAAGTATGSNSC